MNRAEKAEKLFLAGANCAQAVAGAFADVCGMDEKTLFRLASGFGAGMGRMREVCGAVSAMTIVAGFVFASGDAADKNAKDEQYARVQELAGRFRAETGSIVCRELLGLEPGKTEGPESSPRTGEYYRKRPCTAVVALAASILEKFLEENKTLKA